MSKLSALGVLVAAIALAGCAAGDEASEEEDTSDTTEALLAGRKLPEKEVASILREVGFEEDEVPRMVCTAKYESGFYERAVNNRNRNGSVDRGLFQINSIHLGLKGCPKTAEALMTAKTNAACALVIWKLQSNTAWYGYRKHRAECDSYVVDE